MMAVPDLARVPSSLRRFAEEVGRRVRQVVVLEDRIRQQQRLVEAMMAERQLALAEVEEAKRDLNEVRVKWLGAVGLARRIKLLEGSTDPSAVALRAELERNLARVAKEIRASPAEVFRYV